MSDDAPPSPAPPTPPAHPAPASVFSKLNDSLTAFSALIGTLSAIAASVAALFSSSAKNEATQAKTEASSAKESAIAAEAAAREFALRQQKEAATFRYAELMLEQLSTLGARDAASPPPPVAAGPASPRTDANPVRTSTRTTPSASLPATTGTTVGPSPGDAAPIRNILNADEDMRLALMDLMAQASSDTKADVNPAEKRAITFKLALLRGRADFIANQDHDLTFCDQWLTFALWHPENAVRLTAVRALYYISQNAVSDAVEIARTDESRRLQEANPGTPEATLERAIHQSIRCCERLKSTSDRISKKRQLSGPESVTAQEISEEQDAIDSLKPVVELRDYLLQTKADASKPVGIITEKADKSLLELATVLSGFGASLQKVANQSPAFLPGSATAPIRTSLVAKQNETLELINRAVRIEVPSASVPESSDLQKLLVDLKSDDTVARRSARAQIGASNDNLKKLTPLFADALLGTDDDAYRTRYGIATALLQMRNPVVEEHDLWTIIQGIAASDPDTRLNIVDFLINLEDEDTLKLALEQLNGIVEGAILYQNANKDAPPKLYGTTIVNAVTVVGGWTTALNIERQETKVAAARAILKWNGQFQNKPEWAILSKRLNYIVSRIPADLAKAATSAPSPSRAPQAQARPVQTQARPPRPVE